MNKLSKMQQKIYDHIAETIRTQGYPPSVREICDAVGLKSPSTVHFHLKHLEEAGYIEKSAGKGRALALTQDVRTAAVTATETVPTSLLPGEVTVAADAPTLRLNSITNDNRMQYTFFMSFLLFY